MNEKLKPIAKSPDFSLYEVLSGNERTKVYVISTPETRELTTNPFLVGKKYRDALGSAIKKAFSAPDIKRVFENEKDENLNVLHFLRGGLNFEILDVLGDVGKNKVRASFMSSERALEEGKWKIRDDNYVKLNFSDKPTAFIGDIIATGSTLKVGLEKINGRNMKNLILVTIGCEMAEKILADYGKNFDNITIIYIEGRFHCPTKETPARIKIEGTDLIPWNSVLAPEFEEALFQDPIKALERCIVYDGGSRGFYPSHHFKDVLEYTNQVKSWIEKGATLYDLILDRWEKASDISEEMKTKLKSPALARSWVSERTEKINNFLD